MASWLTRRTGPCFACSDIELLLFVLPNMDIRIQRAKIHGHRCHVRRGPNCLGERIDGTCNLFRAKIMYKAHFHDLPRWHVPNLLFYGESEYASLNGRTCDACKIDSIPDALSHFQCRSHHASINEWPWLNLSLFNIIHPVVAHGDSLVGRTLAYTPNTKNAKNGTFTSVFFAK